MPRQTLIDRFLSLLRAQAAPRYFKTVEDGYLTGIGTGADGTEITETEYGQIEAVIAAKPTPPEGYGYRLREDLHWQLYVLPPAQEEDEPLDPDEALEMICGSSKLTRTQAAAYRTQLVRSGAVTDQPAAEKEK